MVQQMIGVAITDALKNVDCDLPPIGELCGPQSQVGKIGSSSVIFKLVVGISATMCHSAEKIPAKEGCQTNRVSMVK